MTFWEIAGWIAVAGVGSYLFTNLMFALMVISIARDVGNAVARESLDK